MVYFPYHTDPDGFDLPDFEFDEAKSRMNADKHGIDFDQAMALWLDPQRVVAPARSRTEPRSLVIGVLEGQFWTALVTHRDEAVRIISVRRSRPEEVDAYRGQ